MDLALKNTSGESAGTVSVSDSAFGADYKGVLVHQVVTAYMAGARAGTKAQKNRSRVAGGGAKPWRQKGTGRARAGTIRSPLWRGGGVTFASQPRNYDQKVNRKMYRSALRSILSELVRQDRLVVVESFELDTPKTKALVDRLKKLDLDDVLIVAEAVSDNLALASRNLHKVDVRVSATVDPYSLVAFERVMITSPALKQLEERMA